MNLYYNSICPLCRQGQIILNELSIDFRIVQVQFWKKSSFPISKMDYNTLPILEIDKQTQIIGIYSLIEYLFEKYQQNILFNYDIESKIEIRRMISWFNEKFYLEVTKIITNEKFLRPLSGGYPRSDFLKISRTNLNKNLKHIENLLSRFPCIFGEKLSPADFVATAHISLLDHFEEINWSKWPAIKQWYCLKKSRNSLQKILSQQIPGFTPPSWYQDPDF